MSNRDQIKARIERDKARKAAKRQERAHGTWRPADCFTLDELSAAANATVFCHAWTWMLTRSTRKQEKKKLSAALAKIQVLNKIIPAEERLMRITPFGEFNRVFTIQNLMKSLQKRRKGVEWKGNVQRYLFHAILKLKRTKDDLLKGKLNVDETIRKIILHERGKRRVIHAVMIDCRVVQGCLCDSCLIPLTEYRLIRDNPASVKGKGVTDARRRLEMFLLELAKKHGSNFYVMTSDFKKFFDSIRHSDCLSVLREIQADRWIQGLGMKINRMYQESELDEIADPVQRERQAQALKHHQGIGLTLGSQESQIMALVIPNRLDHAVKEGHQLRAFERYMDDTFSAAETKEQLKEVGRTIRSEAAKIGLRLNPKKTIIAKASKGMKFLQIFYWATETGHLVKNLARAGIVRMRRKLKKFRKMVDRGVMKLDDVFNSFSSWMGNSYYAHAYKTRKRMLSLYNKLFHRYRMEGVYA